MSLLVVCEERGEIFHGTLLSTGQGRMIHPWPIQLLMENPSHLSFPPILLIMEVALALLQSPPPAPSAFPCPGASPCCSPTTFPRPPLSPAAPAPASWPSGEPALLQLPSPCSQIFLLHPPTLPLALVYCIYHAVLFRDLSLLPCTTLYCPVSSQGRTFPNTGNPKPVVWDPSNFN